MSYSNPQFGITREVRFADTRKLRTASPGSGNQFLIAGQGVLIFSLKVPVTSEFLTEITFSTSANNEGLKFILSSQSLMLLRYKDQETHQLYKSSEGITTDKYAFWWISIDAPNSYFRFGVGEARLETMIFQHKFLDNNDYDFLKKIDQYKFDTDIVLPTRLLRDPVQEFVPLVVKNMNELSMTDIAASRYMPKANLNAIGQQLYENVAGKNFVLNDTDFPDFAEAIEYSIATPGCWCFKKLDEKSKLQPPDHAKRIFLRITLGQNGGESPGIPYVMEVWPPGCYSTIHNHAGANALIRVLHGEIRVYLYAYLGIQQPFNPDGTVFREEDVTWISP
ncbi:MAG: hypothetical protein ACRC3B_01545, partial [Bacteroidia bacterium]